MVSIPAGIGISVPPGSLSTPSLKVHPSKITRAGPERCSVPRRARNSRLSPLAMCVSNFLSAFASAAAASWTLPARSRRRLHAASVPFTESISALSATLNDSSALSAPAVASQTFSARSSEGTSSSAEPGGVGHRYATEFPPHSTNSMRRRWAPRYRAIASLIAQACTDIASTPTSEPSPASLPRRAPKSANALSVPSVALCCPYTSWLRRLDHLFTASTAHQNPPLCNRRLWTEPVW